MDGRCRFRNVVWLNELYWAGGKTSLPELGSHPDPLLTMLSESTSESKHFLVNIRKNKSYFRKIFFKATSIFFIGVSKCLMHLVHWRASSNQCATLKPTKLSVLWAANTLPHSGCRIRLNWVFAINAESRTHMFRSIVMAFYLSFPIFFCLPGFSRVFQKYSSDWYEIPPDYWIRKDSWTFWGMRGWRGKQMILCISFHRFPL